MKIVNRSNYTNVQFFKDNQMRVIGTIGKKDKLLFVGQQLNEPLVCRLTSTNENELVALPLHSFMLHTQEAITLDKRDKEFLDLISSDKDETDTLAYLGKLGL